MSETLKAARARLCCERPYFASALWALRLVPIENMAKTTGLPGHFGVDKNWHLYFDPDVAENTDPLELMAVLVHEIGHLLRRHARRAELFGIGPETHLRWNIAADCELNDDLERDSKLKLPEGYVSPKLFSFDPDLTTEEYYELLENHVKKVSIINCGSGAHNQPMDHESEGGPSIFEKEATIKDTARRIRESRGIVPASWARWAKAEGASQVNWQRELGASLRRAVAESRGLVDYTYKFPNRRQGAFGRVVMPSMLKPNPNPAIVIDTSGSMGEKELQLALTETRGILRAIGFTAISYFAVDAAVAKAAKCRNVNDIELKGGGGTDMRVGIEAALAVKPSVIVVLTDGYTPWPDNPVGCPVVACIINGPLETPDWIKTIEVS